jgi:hypothetical protein
MPGDYWDKQHLVIKLAAPMRATNTLITGCEAGRGGVAAVEVARDQGEMQLHATITYGKCFHCRTLRS